MKKSTDNWKNNLIDIDPYVPGEQPDVSGLIKLNTNENPFPPASSVDNVIHMYNTDNLRKYPSPDASLLVNTISNYYGMPAENIVVGNGSDEVLALAFRAFFNSDKPVLFPDITYSFYPVWCSFFGIDYEQIPLDEEYRIRAYEYSKPNGGIVICNPNAPTGIAEGKEFLEYIVKSNKDSIVIVDEAYVDFGSYSALELIEKHENLFISKSMSKSRSLAGMRIGYGFGSKILIDTFKAVKNSFNSYTLDDLAIRIGTESLLSKNYYQVQIEKILRLRYKYMKALRELGFTVLESQTNFYFITHKDYDAKEIFDYLRENKILVRHFDKPRIDNFLRISIGTEEEMDMLLQTLVIFIEKKLEK